jgi:hypothetical protein
MPRAYSIIPSTQKAEADRLAMEVATASFFSQYPGVDPEQTYSIAEYSGGGITVPDQDSKGWYVGVSVDPLGSDLGGFHVPMALLAVHELRHAEQYSPGERLGKPARFLRSGHLDLSDPRVKSRPYEKKSQAADVSIDYFQIMNEMASTLGTLIDLDTLYKRIHSLPMDQEVAYPVKLVSELKPGLPIGKLANAFRRLSGKYGSLQRALASREGLAFLKSYFRNEPCPSALDILGISGTQSSRSK